VPAKTLLDISSQVNSVSTRHIQPSGPGAFDFVWTHFGFEDDTDEMTQRRLRQANLFGPAGFVSADERRRACSSTIRASSTSIGACTISSVSNARLIQF
jgi:hypothetical protein